jgi:hypothetical protein
VNVVFGQERPSISTFTPLVEKFKVIAWVALHRIIPDLELTRFPGFLSGTKGGPMAVLTIYPYCIGTIWVFDDPRANLKEEAFVAGMTEMISRLVEAKKIPHARTGFALHFSDQAFAGFDAQLNWQETDDVLVVPGQPGGASRLSGNWYTGTVAGQEMRGWLCPALGLYFRNAPPRLFVKVEPLPAGVNPIWPISRNDAQAKRFASAPRA